MIAYRSGVLRADRRVKLVAIPEKDMYLLAGRVARPSHGNHRCFPPSPLESPGTVVDNPRQRRFGYLRPPILWFAVNFSRSIHWLTLFAVGTSLLTSSSAQQDSDSFEFFEKSIRPVLAENCYACHSSKTLATSGLVLDTKAGVLKGGSRGKAVVPGSPESSLLIGAVSYENPDLKMPPTGKLNDQQIADLRRWIALGAPDPRTDHRQPASANRSIDFEEARKFWAFQPVVNRLGPAVRQRDWPRTFIDDFILSKLEEKGLQPATPADKRTLLRRLSFDLIGLPPAPDEIERFLRDKSSAAYDKVVERLLASPHYGERWARHWLDLVRYGETSGHEFDPDKADAWRYRDYVIRAFNQDLPYDRFVKEHIAGDLLPQQRLTPDGTHWDSPLATGFFGLGEERNAADDVAQVRADRVDNQLDVLGKTFLGLTIGCARCHDHKFDPIPTEDYYSLAGVMHSSQVIQAYLDAPSRTRRMKQIDEELVEVNGQITSLMRQARLERVHEIKPYLLAAADLLSKQSGEEAPGDKQIAAYGLSAQTLKRWLQVLQRAGEEPDNVFYPLAKLVKPGSPGEPSTFADRLAALKEELRAWAEKADRKHPFHEERGDLVFEDFEGPDYSGWSAGGGAFGNGPSTYVAPNLAAGGHQGTGTASSFASGTDHWTGTLTSKSFAMNKPYLHVRLAGSERPTDRRKYGELYVSLLAAGRFRSLSADGSGFFHWQTTNVNRTPSQVSFIEIIDRSRDGHIVVDKIVLSDSKEPPPIAGAPSARVVAMLADENMRSIADLASAYEKLFKDVLSRTPSDRDSRGLTAAVSPTGLLEDPSMLLTEDQKERFNELRTKRAELEEAIPDSAYGLVAADDRVHDVPIHIRGSHTNLGRPAPRRFLRILAGDHRQVFSQGSGRAELAEAIAKRDNPLTARVMVNRVWKHHFGRGIVATPDNFGWTGRRPSHPKLLDALAWHFMESGWSLKDLYRVMVRSSTYRISSKVNERAASVDEENVLVHHKAVRRLEAEAIRDAILVVTGTLDHRVYGPSVPPYISPYQDGRGKPESGPLDGARRRSIYIKVQRNFINPLFLAFDYPLPVSTIGRRTTSTVPSQALMLMNNEFVARQAEKWADREIAARGTWRERIESMFVRVFGRPTESHELVESETFLQEQMAYYETDNRDDYHAWADLAHVLINSKEFIFIR